MKKFILALPLVAYSLTSFSQTIPSYVPTTGLLGWYPFSGNANNALGTGKNGSVIGPVLTTDRFGNTNSAYYFNGMLDHIVIDTAFFNNGWSDYTISLWMNSDTADNPNNVNNDQQFINTIPHNGIGLNMNWGHNNKYGIYINSDPSVVSWNTLNGKKTNADISVHTWNHIVFQREHDTAYSFYLNGVLDTTYISHVSLINYFCKINIGNIDSSQGNEGFWGKLDDYGLWNRTLSSCEIKKLFNNSAYLYLTSQPADDTTPVTATARFSVTATGAGNTYQWQESSGAAFTNLSNTTPYSGVTTPTLTITPATSAMTGRRYRCIVNGTGGCADTSTSGRLTIDVLNVNILNPGGPVSVIPNPSAGNIYITGIARADIYIYNATGQLVKVDKHTNNTDITNIAAGAYVVKLFDEQGTQIHTQRIIKE